MKFYFKVLLSFVYLFLFYLVHFVLSKSLYQKFFIDISLNLIALISVFIFSILGGYLAIKTIKEKRMLSFILISVLTFLYMLANYPNHVSSQEYLFYWLNICVMIGGIGLGVYLNKKDIAFLD